MSDQRKEKLIQLAQALVDQQQAKVVVEPNDRSTGFWFGGGNMVVDAAGHLWLAGRYRNQGDSRTGLHLGERGLELTIFCSKDQGASFSKVLHFSKEDLTCGDQRVLSIEGCALRLSDDRAELFVSTEKDGIGYPDEVADYLKPGTGVWTIDVLQAESIEGLQNATVQPLLDCRDPRFLHVKDPFLYERYDATLLLFCSHPFSWTSSNTGFIKRPANAVEFSDPTFDFFPRGFTWDVAMTRGTACIDVPRVGVFADTDCSLVFYDGGECVRNLDEHAASVKRPRGYSCEELGGAAFFENGNLDAIERLSVTAPLFVSPFGETGCSRYVDVLATDDGWYATWQQAQADGSQPLVMNFVSRDTIHSILS